MADPIDMAEGLRREHSSRCRRDTKALSGLVADYGGEATDCICMAAAHNARLDALIAELRARRLTPEERETVDAWRYYLDGDEMERRNSIFAIIDRLAPPDGKGGSNG